MVGVAGKSKGCGTCRKRKIAVSNHSSSAMPRARAWLIPESSVTRKDLSVRSVRGQTEYVAGTRRKEYLCWLIRLQKRHILFLNPSPRIRGHCLFLCKPGQKAVCQVRSSPVHRLLLRFEVSKDFHRFLKQILPTRLYRVAANAMR